MDDNCWQLCCTEDTNSGQGQTANGCAVKGAHEQYHHQRQATLPNFQLPFGQTFQGQVSQLIDGGGASPAWLPLESPAWLPSESPAWLPSESPSWLPSESPACLSTESPACLWTESPACLWTESPACLWTESPACLWTESPACLSTESPACLSTVSPTCWSTESPVCWPTEAPIGVQAVAGLRHGNILQLEGLPVSGLQGVQVQGDHKPQIISNAQILQSHRTYPNLIAEGAVSSPSNYQHIDGVIPNQTVNAGTDISSHQLQKLPGDPNKWHNIATITNPATMSTSNKHSQVNEYSIPNLFIAATATTAKLTKSQTSNSELNAPRRRRKYVLCTCPNCINPDKRNSESREKHICYFPGCTRVFKYASELENHIRWHTGEKPFVCTWLSCGKRYRRSANLRRHEKTHTDEKRFQCTECFKRFSRSDNLTQHFEGVHSKWTFQEPT